MFYKPPTRAQMLRDLYDEFIEKADRASSKQGLLHLSKTYPNPDGKDSVFELYEQNHYTNSRFAHRAIRGEMIVWVFENRRIVGRYEKNGKIYKDTRRKPHTTIELPFPPEPVSISKLQTDEPTKVVEPKDEEEMVPCGSITDLTGDEPVVTIIKTKRKNMKKRTKKCQTPLMYRKRTPQQRDEEWLYKIFNDNTSMEDIEREELMNKCNDCVYNDSVYTKDNPFTLLYEIDALTPCNFYDDCSSNDYIYYSEYKPNNPDLDE
jgi:hypothetical protein